MRTLELTLISLPVFLIAAWFLGLRHASMRVFMALALLLAALGGGLYWMSSDREFRGRYVPAQWQNGRVVPAHLE